MRNRYWITGLMSLAVAAVFALASWAVAQTPDTTAPAASSNRARRRRHHRRTHLPGFAINYAAGPG